MGDIVVAELAITGVGVVDMTLADEGRGLGIRK